MIKNKTLEKLMRFLLAVSGAGLGAGAAALAVFFLRQLYPVLADTLYAPALVYIACMLLGAAVFSLLGGWFIRCATQFLNYCEKKLESMSFHQIVATSVGLVLGLMAAGLISQLILAPGAGMLTISFSAITYVLLGTLGMRTGFRHYEKEPSARAGGEKADALSERTPAKYLDTSVIIDGRVLDIVRTGFLEGQLVVPQFVLAELRHIADSSDQLRRQRGRRGLDVLQKLQKETSIQLDETDYPDTQEVDVKLLRLCREKGGVVLTNDYNLNKVAGVTGIRVLNINDLSNAVKPMLLSGEELTVQIMREGKEPGQGVAYLEDGTMVVVENGRRYVGESITVVVNTVLQTSAGRMIFTKAAEAVKTGA